MYIAVFEYTDAVRHGGRDGHALSHQPDLQVFQKIVRTSFENLSYGRCARLCRANSHVHMKSRRLKDDLPAGRQAASFCRGGLLLTVENEGSDKSLVIGYVFDDLKLEELANRAIC